jgi:glutaryl-CoA dehydrogenase
MPTAPVAPLALLDIDHLLTEEERAIRDVVRDFVETRIKPEVADWFEAGTLPARELAREFGELGVLGMHLEGYGCAGTNAVSYGLAAMELEAGDSGIRSLVSVQGSLAMYAIHAFGSEEQREQWLPGMAKGELIGCFGLTEADFGSNPSGMRTAAKRDGDDWILDGSKMWITNGTVADVAVVWAQTDDGIRGFVVPTDTPGFSASEIHKKLSLRASVTAELVFDSVRLPADAVLPGRGRAQGSAVVPERSPIRHRLSEPWALRVTAWRRRSRIRSIVSSSTSRSPDINSPRRSSPTWRSNWARACCSPCTSVDSRTSTGSPRSRSASAS